MILVPALSLANPANQTSLFSEVYDRGFSITQLLQDFYIGANALFFVTLISTQAVFSSAFYLLNFSDIFTSYGSAWLAYHKRKIFQDQEPWLRKEEDTFQYGYFYAQMMTVLGICIFFSSQMPLITLSAFLFFFLRHCVDMLNLLTVFRKEIDSQGRMIEIAMSSAIAILVLYQIGSIFYCFYNDFQDQSIACLLIFLATIFYIAITQSPVNQKIRNITSDRLTHQIASDELQR